jgi:hypothetical protein
VEKCGRARQATDGNIIRRMRFACWITKATDTYSAYVVPIAFPWQQWLQERSFLLLTCVRFLSCYYPINANFSISDVHIVLLHICRLRENRQSRGRTCLININEITFTRVPRTRVRF